MPHPVFHTIEMPLIGMTFYSRECCQFQNLVDHAKFGQQTGEVPKGADLECFVLSVQADCLYRAPTKGKN